jgi:aspartate-semialdehyde dehydrogenase
MKVAVVGATGLVGTKMLQVLEERNFPITKLYPVASASLGGQNHQIRRKKIQDYQSGRCSG